jgi:hypothetical protein
LHNAQKLSAHFALPASRYRACLRNILRRVRNRMVGFRQMPIAIREQPRERNRLGSACVSSATGRIRRGERAGERVLAIANFHLMLPYSRDVAQKGKPVSARHRCNGCEATARLSNQHTRGVRYPESAVPVCVAAGRSGAATGGCATGKKRLRNSSAFGNSSRLRRPK